MTSTSSYVENSHRRITTPALFTTVYYIKNTSRDVVCARFLPLYTLLLQCDPYLLKPVLVGASYFNIPLLLITTRIWSSTHLPAASPVSCVSIAPPLLRVEEATERNQDPAFCRELEKRPGEKSEEEKVLMKNSSAKKEMEGECHYGDGEEVEEGRCAR